MTLTACSEEVNRVRLTLPAEGANGLACVEESTGTPLLTRATIDGTAAEASVIVDYLAFEGVPSCRAFQIYDWCTSRGCPIVRRNCRRVRVESPDMSSVAAVQAQLVEAIEQDGILTHDAPDGVVMVRVTFTSQLCEEVLPAGGVFPKPRCESLMGCVYSCPVQLDEVMGDVLLELDVLASSCTDEVVGICAGLGHDGDAFCAP